MNSDTWRGRENLGAGAKTYSCEVVCSKGKASSCLD